MRRPISLAVMCSIVLLAFAHGAEAQNDESGGPPARNEKHCDAVSDDAKKVECKECVKRTPKHHFHPTHADGTRCHKDK